MMIRKQSPDTLRFLFVCTLPKAPGLIPVSEAEDK